MASKNRQIIFYGANGQENYHKMLKVTNSTFNKWKRPPNERRQTAMKPPNPENITAEVPEAAPYTFSRHF